MFVFLSWKEIAIRKARMKRTPCNKTFLPVSEDDSAPVSEDDSADWEGDWSEDQDQWRIKIEEICTQLDDRSINVVCDNFDNAGKSLFAEHLEWRGLAYDIPAMRSMEDIMQCVMASKNKKAYLIDLPRGMKKDKMADFYSGIENIKDGVAYDKRCAFKKIRFDRPQVIVFTNVLPDFGVLSMNRWKIWMMDEDHRIVDMTQASISAWKEKMARKRAKKRDRGESDSD